MTKFVYVVLAYISDYESMVHGAYESEEIAEAVAIELTKSGEFVKTRVQQCTLK